LRKKPKFSKFPFLGSLAPNSNLFSRKLFGYNAFNFGNMSLQWNKKFQKNLKFLKIAFYFGGPSSPNFVQILFLCKNLKDHLVWNKTANFGWNSLGRSLNHRDTKFSKLVPFSTPVPGPLEQTEISTLFSSSYSVLIFVPNIVTMSLTVSQLRHVYRAFGRKNKKNK